MRRAASILAFAVLGALTAFGPSRAQPAELEPPAQAQAPVVVGGTGANLNITPKRIVLDRGRRSGTVFIYNQGDGAATFDISLVDRVMRPDGQIAPAADAAEKPEFRPYAEKMRSAGALLLVSPRRVSLAPRQGQTIRVRLLNSPQPLEAGEYRSHLTVTTIPPRTVGPTAEAVAATPANQLRLTVNAMFGVSIPVIVRVGDVDVRAAIENVRLEEVEAPAAPGAPSRRMPVASFDLVRLGTSSLFGNIEVRLAGQRRGDPIGVARGVGVYPEIERRLVRIPLSRIRGVEDKIEITFTDDDSAPGKVLAKAAP